MSAQKPWEEIEKGLDLVPVPSRVCDECGYSVNLYKDRSGDLRCWHCWRRYDDNQAERQDQQRQEAP